MSTLLSKKPGDSDSKSGQENIPNQYNKKVLPAELKSRPLSPQDGLGRSPSTSSIPPQGIAGYERTPRKAPAPSQSNLPPTLSGSSRMMKSRSTPHIGFSDSPTLTEPRDQKGGMSRISSRPNVVDLTGPIERIERTERSLSRPGSSEGVNRVRSGSLESGRAARERAESDINRARSVSTEVAPPRSLQRPNSRAGSSRPVTPTEGGRDRDRDRDGEDRVLSRPTTPGERKQNRTSMKFSPMMFSKKEADMNMQQIMQVLAALQDSKSPLADRRSAVSKLVDVLGEESSAVQQRLHVLLRPLQTQLVAETEICKDVCSFLQTLARNQPAPDKLAASYVNFASQIITQLLELVSAGNSQKREFVIPTLERLIDGTQTKDTLGILVCYKYTHNQANPFLLDLLALLQRAVQNWDPEFFRKTTHINMIVEPLSGLVQSKSEKVQAIALQCVKQLSAIAPPAFEKRVIKSLPTHLKTKIAPTAPLSPPVPAPAPPPPPVPAPPPPTKKPILNLRKTPKKLKLLLSEPKPPVTPPPPPKPPKVVLSKTPEVGSHIEVSGVTYLIEKVIFKSQSGEGGVYRVYHKEEDTRYAYKIIVGDVESSELNSLLTMQDSNYVIKVINSEVVEDETTHLITELGEVNMEDYILDHWDKWTHNKIRSIAEEILFAIRDIHAVSFIHGDITPRNFVLVKGSLKLIDFGLTRSLPSGATNILVPINQMKGSPDFLPPEVFRASRRGPFELYKYSNGVDLWAAGVILHLMATGLTPFAGMSDVQISELTEMPPIKNMGYPHLHDLLAQMLCYDISARPTLDMILAHPFFGGSPAPSISRLDPSWSKFNRLSVSSTSSTEGNDTDSASSSFLSIPSGASNSANNSTTNLLFSMSPSNNFSPNSSISSTNSSGLLYRDSPISPRSLASLHGLSPMLSSVQSSASDAPAQSLDAQDTQDAQPTQAPAQEDVEVIVLEDNPLALLTPGAIKRRSVPTAISPKRTLTSQDSKIALFGNLFGPVTTPAPSNDDVIEAPRDEPPANGLMQNMFFGFASNNNMDEGDAISSDEEHE